MVEGTKDNIFGPHSPTLDAFFLLTSTKFNKTKPPHNHHHKATATATATTNNNKSNYSLHPKIKPKKMGDAIHRRQSYLVGCMSPSCIPVHEAYARVDQVSDGGKNHRSRRLRKLLRKIVKESKNFYGSAKPLSFQYDAVSYSQNFDDGYHRSDDECAGRYVATTICT